MRQGRLLIAGVLVATPLIAVVAMQVAGISGEPLPLVLAALAPLVGATMLDGVHQDDLAAVIDHLRRLGEFSEPPPPPPPAQFVSAQGLLTAVQRFDAAWHRRLDRADARQATAESVLESLPDPLFLVDSRRRVTLANAAARALLGEFMVGRDLTVAWRKPAVVEAVEAALTGQVSAAIEVSWSERVEQVFEVRILPFHHPDGDQEGHDQPAVIVILRDITVIRRAEQMRADFVANASHELRTPLSSLLGFIETLRGPARDDADARERFLAIMHEQAGRMARLIADLLSLSRIEVDEASPPTTTVDVVRCVRSAAAALELKAAERRIRLLVEAPQDLPAVVGDADQLAQVFHNLIGNALKYGRERTEVTIALTVVDSAACGSRPGTTMVGVAIKDQGEGIAPFQVPRLTERFYRVDAARSRELGGTGLGLAIVKHIVNRHRGRLTIASEVGKGSVFTVWLPAAKNDGTVTKTSS
ncbi:two-component system, OmpR family, phosphate regulon sensor histidine kinase PhoR [uncultured Gammaproteobacteria bacterium]